MILNRICWLNYFVIWVEFLLNVSCNNCDLDKYLNFELNACKVQLQCVSCFNVVFEVKFISDIGQAILPIVCSFVFMFQEELKKYSNEVGTKGGARWCCTPSNFWNYTNFHMLNALYTPSILSFAPTIFHFLAAGALPFDGTLSFHLLYFN